MSNLSCLALQSVMVCYSRWKNGGNHFETTAPMEVTESILVPWSRRRKHSVCKSEKP